MSSGQLMWVGAWKTVATLFGGLLAGLLLGNLVFSVLPGFSVTNPKVQNAVIAAIPTIIVFAVGSAAWGRSMGRLTGVVESKRMAWAGILGFAPITIVMGFLLFRLEPIAVERFGERLPIHRVFTLLFVPTAFIIASISAWAIGVGLRDKALSRALAWRVGLTSAAAFLAVNLVMEAAGWVVGAPGAAERATMVTVMSLGNLVAALSGGAVLGLRLGRRAPAATTAND
ncbi:MAG TPA: hypothetical protein VNM36_04640 [Gemmatimonadaceae bacterium]|nr:hypothetical protein [Gemmatimonadaceae bacterium]